MFAVCLVPDPPLLNVGWENFTLTPVVPRLPSAISYLRVFGTGIRIIVEVASFCCLLTRRHPQLVRFRSFPVLLDVIPFQPDRDVGRDSLLINKNQAERGAAVHASDYAYSLCISSLFICGHKFWLSRRSFGRSNYRTTRSAPRRPEVLPHRGASGRRSGFTHRRPPPLPSRKYSLAQGIGSVPGDAEAKPEDSEGATASFFVPDDNTQSSVDCSLRCLSHQQLKQVYCWLGAFVFGSTMVVFSWRGHHQ